MRRYRILLVDDEPVILAGVGADLLAQGYDVIRAEGGAAACRCLEAECFDIVITDLVMEGVDGMQVLAKAKAVDSCCMVMILTGYGDLSSAIDAMRLSADDYLLKPCDPEEMHFRIDQCIKILEMRRRIKTYENIITVCCVCGKIRDDMGCEPGKGDWLSIEQYLWRRAMIAPSSTYCPECALAAENDF